MCCRRLTKSSCSENRYVAIKVCESDSVVAQRELAAYHRIETAATEHPGKALLRELLDHFEIPSRGPNPHLCLAHEPLSFSVEDVRCLLPGCQLQVQFAKSVLQHVLRALDFLHKEADIVHGGTVACLHSF